MKKRRTLTYEEKMLLLHCLREHAPELVGEAALLDSGLVNADAVNKMREAVGNELMLKGFEPDDEPNKYGLTVEDLMDRLADLYVWPDAKKSR